MTLSPLKLRIRCGGPNLGNGDGTFQSGTTIGSLPGTNVDAITVVDLNNDGYPDIVAADGRIKGDVALFEAGKRSRH